MFSWRIDTYTSSAAKFNQGAKIKQGGSPFKFDEAVDLGTLEIALAQQVFGPVIVASEVEFNIDKGSEYYGKAIDSTIELRLQKRAYDIGIYYNPYKGIGGFNIRLNDFSYNGNGVPFLTKK